MVNPRGERGQASIELVALLPVLVVVGLLAWQAAVVGQATWLAAGAARDAARAQALGRDPEAAARRALPAGLRRGLTVTAEDDGAVRLRIAIPAVLLRGHPLGAVGARARMESQT